LLLDISITMNITQFKNLIGFSFLFLKACDVKLIESTPEYIMGKYKSLIDVPITNLKGEYSVEFESFLNELYFKKWGIDINSSYVTSDEFLKFKKVFRYLFIINYRFEYSLRLTPKILVQFFEKYIGDSNLITKDDYATNCIHELIRRDVLRPYMESHSRTIKIMTLYSE